MHDFAYNEDCMLSFLTMCCWGKHGKMQIQAEKINNIATISDEKICSFDSQEHMGWHDDSKNQGLLLTKKCKKSCNDESSEGSKNTDSPAKTINEDNKHSTTTVITGQWTSAWHGSCQYGGWSSEGLNQFNQLMKIVKQDRENDKHFQAQYEIWLNERNNKKPKEKVKPLVVRAYHDLSSLEV